MIDLLICRIFLCYVICCRSAYKLLDGYFMEYDEQGSKAASLFKFFFLSSFLKC